jgi:hypothetical protein
MSDSPATPNRLPADEWIERVRSATAGPELLDWLAKRFTRPYDEGPILDDRRGEGPEEVFEQMAAGDEAFRARLDKTIADYFESPAANPADKAIVPVLRGLLEMVQRLALTRAFAPLRAWLQQLEAELRAEGGAYLARAALGALATSQPRGLSDVRDFWLHWWRNGPPPWQPRAFIGLRLNDPRAAADEIPLLVRRAREQNQDPRALIQGMWNQPDGREALSAWLQHNEHAAEAKEVRKALGGNEALPDVPRVDLSRLGAALAARAARRNEVYKPVSCAARLVPAPKKKPKAA